MTKLFSRPRANSIGFILSDPYHGWLAGCGCAPQVFLAMRQRMAAWEMDSMML